VLRRVREKTDEEQQQRQGAEKSKRDRQTSRWGQISW